jgi:hypothetical protein
MMKEVDIMARPPFFFAFLFMWSIERHIVLLRNLSTTDKTVPMVYSRDALHEVLNLSYVNSAIGV